MMLTTLIILLAIALLLISVSLFSIATKLDRLAGQVEETRSTVTKISLQVHTRQRIAEMGNGPETQEKQLSRLGRASMGRRVVVGGDPDSQQYRDLTAQVEKGDDNE